MKIHLNNLPESLLHAEREAQTLFQQLVSSGIYEPMPQPSPLVNSCQLMRSRKQNLLCGQRSGKLLRGEDVNPAFF